MFERTPAELSFDSIYFPPLFFAAIMGLLCAFGIWKLLTVTGLSRWFWNEGLVFFALWILSTSLIGLTILPS